MFLDKKLIFALSFILAYSSTAASGTFPVGCQVTGFGFNQNFLLLNENGNQAFYLIENHSNKPIQIELHETREVFMSPKLHSKLDPLQWSAFASDVQNQHLKCFTQEGENTTIINCKDVLDVCQYPHVKFALSNMGNYWVSTNKEQAQVIKDTVAKGIWLKWR